MNDNSYGSYSCLCLMMMKRLGACHQIYIYEQPPVTGQSQTRHMHAVQAAFFFERSRTLRFSVY